MSAAKDVKDDRKYTKDHEWAKTEGGEVVVGITAFAVDQLGDITLVNIDVKPGDAVDGRQGLRHHRERQDAERSVRAGQRQGRRGQRGARGQAELVNEDCWGKGWMIAIEPTSRPTKPTLCSTRPPTRRHLEESAALMRYLPHTPEEIAEMLRAIGKRSLDELFASIPQAARFDGALARARRRSTKPTLMAHLRELAREEHGARACSRSSAPACTTTTSRRRSISCSCAASSTRPTRRTSPRSRRARCRRSSSSRRSSASSSACRSPTPAMYDGASAAAEAVLMARRLTKRERDRGQRLRSSRLPRSDRDLPAAPSAARTSTVAGRRRRPRRRRGARRRARRRHRRRRRRLPELLRLARRPARRSPSSRTPRARCLIATCAEPYALAIAESPGALGADIAVGEGQPLACPPQFGGPGVGPVRLPRRPQLPAAAARPRLRRDRRQPAASAATCSRSSTREQHIRRERATSNICTNQGLLRAVADHPHEPARQARLRRSRAAVPAPRRTTCATRFSSSPATRAGFAERRSSTSSRCGCAAATPPTSAESSKRGRSSPASTSAA